MGEADLAINKYNYSLGVITFKISLTFIPYGTSTSLYMQYTFNMAVASILIIKSLIKIIIFILQYVKSKQPVYISEVFTVLAIQIQTGTWNSKFSIDYSF